MQAETIGIIFLSVNIATSACYIMMAMAEAKRRKRLKKINAEECKAMSIVSLLNSAMYDDNGCDSSELGKFLSSISKITPVKLRVDSRISPDDFDTLDLMVDNARQAHLDCTRFALAVMKYGTHVNVGEGFSDAMFEASLALLKDKTKERLCDAIMHEQFLEMINSGEINPGQFEAGAVGIKLSDDVIKRLNSAGSSPEMEEINKMTGQ